MVKGYELQTLLLGRWQIDSLFDDEDSAVQEAYRVKDEGRFDAVRVIEETFDEETGVARTRMIVRLGKKKEPPSTSVEGMEDAEELEASTPEEIAEARELKGLDDVEKSKRRRKTLKRLAKAKRRGRRRKRKKTKQGLVVTLAWRVVWIVVLALLLGLVMTFGFD